MNSWYHYLMHTKIPLAYIAFLPKLKKWMCNFEGSRFLLSGWYNYDSNFINWCFSYWSGVNFCCNWMEWIRSDCYQDHLLISCLSLFLPIWQISYLIKRERKRPEKSFCSISIVHRHSDKYNSSGNPPPLLPVADSCLTSLYHHTTTNFDKGPPNNPIP